MGCGASSQPQVSPRGNSQIKPAPFKADVVKGLPEESHDEFLNRYKAKQEMRMAGKVLPWDQREEEHRAAEMTRTQEQKKEIMDKMVEAKAPDWVVETAAREATARQMTPSTAARSVEAATWASRVIYQKNQQGQEGAESVEMALHKTSRVFGGGGAKAKGFGYDKAFDGDLETHVHCTANGKEPSFVALHFDKAYHLARFRFHPAGDYSDRMIGGVFEASTIEQPECDEWQSLHTVPDTVTEDWHLVKVESGDAFRCFRYCMVDGGCIVGNIEVFGKEAPVKPGATPKKEKSKSEKSVTKGALMAAIKAKETNGKGSMSPRCSPNKRAVVLAKREFLSKAEKYCIMSGTTKPGIVPLKFKFMIRELVTRWYKNVLQAHGIDPALIDQKKGKGGWF